MIEMIKRAMEKLDEIKGQSKIDLPGLEDMVKAHGIRNIALLHTAAELRGVPLIPTPYGDLKLIYNPLLPPGSWYLMQSTGWKDLMEPRWGKFGV